jgi:hypothetical protein
MRQHPQEGTSPERLQSEQAGFVVTISRFLSTGVTSPNRCSKRPLRSGGSGLFRGQMEPSRTTDRLSWLLVGRFEVHIAASSVSNPFMILAHISSGHGFA